jgi:hypothetical protein
MAKTLLYLTLFLAAVSCSQSPYGKWQNKTKWELPLHIQKAVVRGRPGQVTEWGYPAGDSAKPVAQRRKHFTRYRFDSTGMATQWGDYFHDSLQTETRQWLDKDGIQQRMTEGMTGHASLLVSQRLADGRYKVTGTGFFGLGAVKIIIGFISDSDEVIQEYYTDPAVGARPFEVERDYYQGQRLMRIMREWTDTGGQVEIRYFYSLWDVPDSMLTFKILTGEKLLDQRELFYRNSHGDIVRQMAIKGGDSSDRVEYSYIYDSKGNWIKVVSNPVRDSSRDHFNPKPTIVEREFVY